MAWLCLGIVVWVTVMFLVTPLLRKNVNPSEHSAEIKDYKDEIERLTAEIDSGDDPELAARKIELQRQLLTLTQIKTSESSGPSMLVINSLFAFFVFGGIGLYALLGSPELTKAGALQTPPPATAQAMSPDSLDTLLGQLKDKLDGERKDDPNGWMLYARTLMNMGRYGEAFAAYETALTLTNNDAAIAEELTRARAFATQDEVAATPRGPSAEDVEAAAEMTTEDRNAMIENMVAGLSTRLRGEPDNPDGWARLIRARIVLGQTDQAAEDVAFMRKTYAEQPDVAAQIIAQTGWQP